MQRLFTFLFRILLLERRLLFVGFWNLHSDLTNRSVFSEDIVHFLGCYFVGQVSNIENAIYLRRKPHLVQINEKFRKKYIEIFLGYKEKNTNSNLEQKNRTIGLGLLKLQEKVRALPFGIILCAFFSSRGVLTREKGTLIEKCLWGYVVYFAFRIISRIIVVLTFARRWSIATVMMRYLLGRINGVNG